MVSNSRGCEPQPTPLNHEGHELPLDLNLTQLVEHKKQVRRRKMHSQLEFEHIIRPWHWKLGANENVSSLPQVFKFFLLH